MEVLKSIYIYGCLCHRHPGFTLEFLVVRNITLEKNIFMVVRFGVTGSKKRFFPTVFLTYIIFLYTEFNDRKLFHL